MAEEVVNKYRKMVSVKHPDFDKGEMEFMRKVNIFEMENNVEHAHYAMTWSNNGGFVFTMLFCCIY